MSGDLAPVEAPDDSEPTTVSPALTKELGTMRRLVNNLDALDPAARARVLRWLNDRYQQGEASA